MGSVQAKRERQAREAIRSGRVPDQSSPVYAVYQNMISREKAEKEARERAAAEIQRSGVKMLQTGVIGRTAADVLSGRTNPGSLNPETQRQVDVARLNEAVRTGKISIPEYERRASQISSEFAERKRQRTIESGKIAQVRGRSETAKQDEARAIAASQGVALGTISSSGNASAAVSSQEFKNQQVSDFVQSQKNLMAREARDYEQLQKDRLKRTVVTPDGETRTFKDLATAEKFIKRTEGSYMKEVQGPQIPLPSFVSSAFYTLDNKIGPTKPDEFKGPYKGLVGTFGEQRKTWLGEKTQQTLDFLELQSRTESISKGKLYPFDLSFRPFAAIGKEILGGFAFAGNLGAQVAAWQKGREQTLTKQIDIPQTSLAIGAEKTFIDRVPPWKVFETPEMKDYLKKYGLLGVVAEHVTLYPGTAATKGLLPFKVAKETTPIIAKGGIYIGKTLTKTVLKPQVPPTLKSIGSVIHSISPIKITQPPYMSAGGKTYTHTALGVGYGKAYATIGGKYRGGTFFRGKATDFEQSGLGTQKGASGESSFDVLETIHYTERQLKEIEPLVLRGEELGIFGKGRWELQMMAKTHAEEALKKQRYIEYKKNIDIGKYATGETRKSIIAGERKIQKKLFDLEQKFIWQPKTQQQKELFREAKKSQYTIKEISPPEGLVLYHGTLPENALSILSSGFDLSKSVTSKGTIFTNTSPKGAYGITGTTLKVVMSKGAKVLDVNKGFADWVDTDIRAFAKKNEYDLIKNLMQGQQSVGKEIEIVSTKNILKIEPVSTRVPKKVYDINLNKYRSTNIRKISGKWINKNLIRTEKVLIEPKIPRQTKLKIEATKKFIPKPIIVKETRPGFLSGNFLKDIPIPRTELGLLSRIHIGIKDVPAWLNFSKAQKKGWLEDMKGSGIFQFVEGSLVRKIKDIDVGAVTDEKGVLARDLLITTKTKEPFAFGPKGSNVVIGEVDLASPRWNLTPYIDKAKGKFVRGTNLFRSKQLESDPTSFKKSPRGVLWTTDAPGVTKTFTKKAVKADKRLDPLGGVPAKTAVEIDMSKIYQFEKAPKEVQKEFASFFEKGRDDWFESQKYLEKISREEGKLGYTKPYHSTDAKAPKYEVVIFDEKAIKNVENIAPTSYRLKNEKEVFNIVTSREELKSGFGVDTKLFYGKKVKYDKININIPTTKQKIEFQSLAKQNIDLTGSTSGIVDRDTLRAWSGWSRELEDKVFPKRILSKTEIEESNIKRLSQDIDIEYGNTPRGSVGSYKGSFLGLIKEKIRIQSSLEKRVYVSYKAMQKFLKTGKKEMDVIPTKSILKHELIHRANIDLPEKQVLKLEHDKYGLTKAISSGTRFNPITPHIDTQVIYGLPVFFRQKDLARKQEASRLLAKFAWKAGDKEYAQRIGKEMNLRYNLEKGWLDWRTLTKETLIDADVVFNTPPPSQTFESIKKGTAKAARTIKPGMFEAAKNDMDKAERKPSPTIKSVSDFKPPRLSVTFVSPIRSPSIRLAKIPSIKLSPASIKMMSTQSFSAKSISPKPDRSVDSPKPSTSPLLRSPGSPIIKSPSSPFLKSPGIPPSPGSPFSPGSPRTGSPRTLLSPRPAPTIFTTTRRRPPPILALNLRNTTKKAKGTFKETHNFLGWTKVAEIGGARTTRKDIDVGDELTRRLYREDLLGTKRRYKKSDRMGSKNLLGSANKNIRLM